MEILRVRLLGQLHIQRGEQVVTNLLPPKLQELFCYLLLFRDRPHQRETLASLLCSTSSTTQSKRNLRQALWQLQSSAAIRDDAGHSDLFLVDARWIQLNPTANLWLDVQALDQAYSRSEGMAGLVLDATQIQALHDAVELYQGDLLEGCFQDWCFHERERLQNIYLCVLEKLMDHCEVYGQYEAGLAYGARVLQYDGARERTFRRLMRLHYLAGERSAAMRQYDHCVKTLRRELDVTPSARTVALYQQVRKGHLKVMTRRPTSQSRPSEAPEPERSEMLRQLRQMQRDLDHLQEQLGDAIRKAEQVGSRKTDRPAPALKNPHQGSCP